MIAVERLMTPRAVAVWLGKSEGALAHMRHDGSGPDYIKFKRTVRYDRLVVQEWIDKRRRSET